MADSCYICRRTQADLDRLNEEIRTRVYLSYFSNERTQIEERQRNIVFLQRLKDEESGDPHFRINAKQVFGDPKAYEKLMPWIDTLMGIANAGQLPVEDRWTMAGLVDALLAEERHQASKMEQGLNQLRAGFATGGTSPLSLENVTYSFPVDWSIEADSFTWHASQASDREPLRRQPGESKTAVEMQVHLCSVCQKILGKP